MCLTENDVMSLPIISYTSIWNLQNEIYNKYSCGISKETAERILKKYNDTKIKLIKVTNNA